MNIHDGSTYRRLLRACIHVDLTHQRGETDEELATRGREHRAQIMRERIGIDWRA